ncbi:unnamed protein product [Candidula unifasciata]|uniref:G-protein coupled receptors family 1 profile domain-containing protein n=1 Tax=Candidula unifasciata TaxID=100452 RepID=A0A8S3ZEU4_9EUPU|nr:unnamed protein product [Candidula unifasciata]
MSLTTRLWEIVDDVIRTTTIVPLNSYNGNIRLATTTFIYTILDIIISYVINFSVIIFGIGTNICNIYIYANLGLKDTVSISFLALSASDLCLLTLALVSRINAFLTYLAVQSPVNLFQLGYLIVWYFQMMLDISTFTTTFIAVQRCLCVALPFQVRALFTRNRTVGCIVCVYASVFSCYVPMFSKQFLAWRVDPYTNITVYVIYYAEGRDGVLAFADVTCRIVFRIVPEIIVIACLVVLISNLRASVAFRQKSLSDARGKKHIRAKSSPKLQKNYKQGSSNSTEAATEITSIKPEGTRDSDQVPSNRKEKQAVLVVTLTSIIFITTNTPSIFLGFTRRFLPGFNLYQKYHDIFYLSYNLNNSLQFINATINFFVYFKYNSKFRGTVSSRFRILPSCEM